MWMKLEIKQFRTNEQRVVGKWNQFHLVNKYSTINTSAPGKYHMLWFWRNKFRSQSGVVSKIWNIDLYNLYITFTLSCQYNYYKFFLSYILVAFICLIFYEYSKINWNEFFRFRGQGCWLNFSFFLRLKNASSLIQYCSYTFGSM